MKTKQPKLFGKDEDGFYEGRIEQIGTGKTEDTLMLSNRKQNVWIFSLLSGYRQLGTFKIKKPYNFIEGQDVVIEKKNGEIESVTGQAKATR